METGFISSIETMGLVDGPGIRCVVFFSGCHLRCKFCHNPDTWCKGVGMQVTVAELMEKIKRFIPYFSRSGGGVTFSGGEPLLQPAFLLAMLKECRKEGIHTCLDTAGVGLGQYEEILAYTDLVLYDVKATEGEMYHHICLGDIEKTERFQTALAKMGTPTIVRQVVIPSINDTHTYMCELVDYIETHLPTTIGVELLPYHKMGVHKYEKMGLRDPLPQIPQMDKAVVAEWQRKYFVKWNGERENA